MVEKCSGLILYRNREGTNELEFFVCHPYPLYGYSDMWYFPKGHIEEKDFDNRGDFMTERNCVIREYTEETGDLKPIEMNIYPIYLGMIKQRKTKIVHVFIYECTWDLRPENCFSNMFEVEHNGKMITIPENDKYKWMSYNELKDKTHTTL